MFEEVPDDPHVSVTDAAVALGLGGGAEIGRQGLSGQGVALAEVGGFGQAAVGFGAGHMQPVGQHRGQSAAQLGWIGLFGKQIQHRMLGRGQPARDPL
ncbi:hypothetical protein MKUB_37470 [Mycobacterium kubicae]|uniref:PPE family C-terminal domain-containing protein n=1 Tax=Mycobacterium kubicae TaxID=120959 RepID=A0ABQ1BRH9_9MYCO|nr:hypothetical protein MKUB_37470 [Mycobacterium kubicae]